MSMQYVKARFVGPTATKGSRIRIEQLRGFAQGNGKKKFVSFDYTYNGTIDQMKADGGDFMFEDKTDYYFSRPQA